MTVFKIPRNGIFLKNPQRTKKARNLQNPERKMPESLKRKKPEYWNPEWKSPVWREIPDLRNIWLLYNFPCADDAHEWLWLINFATQQTTRVFIKSFYLYINFQTSILQLINWIETTVITRINAYLELTPPSNKRRRAKQKYY